MQALVKSLFVKNPVRGVKADAFNAKPAVKPAERKMAGNRFLTLLLNALSAPNA
ncbi:MAG: hypothetical protein HY289_09450 [Planctomycetes bacterium]|nr:hypothetical protein [Planctomycetota bacterium]